MASPPSLRTNLLLGRVPAHELAALEPDLDIVEIDHHHVFSEPGEAPDHAWFPLSSVVSLVITDTDGRAVEVASVGREGVVGVSSALAGVGVNTQVIQQVRGYLARIRAERLRQAIEEHPGVASILDRYAAALLAQVSQGMLCLRFHPVESRAARWLLATNDRVQDPEFELTQDFLAVMLGQTRPQVSIAAGALRRAGLIDYTRGRIRIVDRPALEQAACECYSAIRSEFGRLLGDGDVPGG